MIIFIGNIMFKHTLRLVVICIFINNGNLFSQETCLLDKYFHGKKLMQCLFILPDGESVYSEDAVFDALNSEKFVPVETISETQLRQLHWLKIRVSQNFEEELELVLKFSDLRGAWQVQNNQLKSAFYSGYEPSYDTAHQAVLKDNHRFIFKLKHKDTLTFLFKTYPKYLERGDVIPTLYDLKKYEHDNYVTTNISTLLNGIVLGIMLLFLSIAFLVFFLYKEQSYLAYIFYLIFVLAYLWRDFEYLNLFFFSTMKYVAWHETKLIMNCVIGTSYILFIKLLLNTKVQHPKVDKILTVFMVLLVIAVPLDYIGSEWMNWWHYKVGMYYAGGTALVTQIFYNAYFIRDKDPVVRYIVVGTFFLTLGAISIPIFDVSIHTWIVRLCFILEMIFFTAALSQKIKNMYKERNRVENELKEAQIRHEYETQIKLENERQTTEEKIRNDIARDIHDEVGAELAKISLASHVLSKSERIYDDDIKSKILKIGHDASQTHKQLRQLLFSINPTYDHFDVIQLYFKEIASLYFSDTHIQVVFDSQSSTMNPKMDRIVKSQLLLILKEGMQNIVRHANASKVLISLNMTSHDQYKLVIKDDGQGFDDSANHVFSAGLKNMKARATKIHAYYTINSVPNNGTEIIVAGPVHIN